MAWSCSKDDNEKPLQDNIEVVEELTISEEILLLVNEHRQSIGKSELIRNEIADEIAEGHTNYMVYQNQISHDNFNGRFQELQNLVAANSAGENVGYGYPTAVTVMDAWPNSPGHRNNIEGNFTHIGIGSIKNDQGVYYFTQLFYR